MQRRDHPMERAEKPLPSAPPPITPRRVCIDGNEAAARVAYALSEAICLYPITPASPMGEHAETWAAQGQTNLWGSVPRLVEMQSEAGAAAALHGAVQAGTLGTSFTASQGLLLMLPEMFRIAGELTPAVLHVAARALATHALSIFGDHSDVMAARTTGWTMLASASPQEAHDLAAVAHAATLASRLPVVHFFDGFRTSHELNTVDLLDDADLTTLVDERQLLAHREHGLDPERPVLRGTAQNPDVFFQAREAANPFHDAVPSIVQATMDRLAALTGRYYHLVDYHGAPDAERVVVLMGSGTGAATEAVDHLVGRGERVGVLTVRLFRPFPTEQLLAALPATVRRVAVLDRTKEPGAPGEPLFEDVVHTLAGATMDGVRPLPLVVGGRYGLGSKEFTAADVAAVFAELAAPAPRSRFTVGIVDDLTYLSLPVDPAAAPPRPRGERSAILVGLGSDGTVGASKNSARIIASATGLHVQDYSVYDSKKSGAVTATHLRLSPEPIRSSYLVDGADIVACHQFGLLARPGVLDAVAAGGTVLLNAPFGPDEVWHRLPADAQELLVRRGARLAVIDAHRIAREAGLGGRISTVMQVAFFSVADVLPLEEAVEAISTAAATSYAEHGPEVVERNLAAIRAAVGAVHDVEVAANVTSEAARPRTLDRALQLLPAGTEVAPVVERVLAKVLDGEGELLPVSAFVADGTFPTATARFEKRSLATELPQWHAESCIDCGRCAIVCPHAAIRIKAFEPEAVEDAPQGFPHKPLKDRALPGHHLTVQVFPDDCTSCGLCVEACPRPVGEDGTGALGMVPVAETVEVERERARYFLDIAPLERTRVRHDTVKHSQLLEPLFEFSGACTGCGETPYLKLLSQLFGDRMVVANATGCSSIYGANLPTTPWSVDRDGRGPAWSNSLFEDNAEFGLGLRLGTDAHREAASTSLRALSDLLGEAVVAELLAGADRRDEAGIIDQRERVAALREQLAEVPKERAATAQRLLATADALVHRDVWIVGGDGWAYDIGFGGLDHVLASGADVNVLVLDTEAYSNTGGQASKATPRAAVAPFAALGKDRAKKDLGRIALLSGDVYVARVALGADPMQTVRAFQEAAAYPGPSLVLAYSPCIAHGADMRTSLARTELAVATGHWPLYRFDPSRDGDGRGFRLDAKPPSAPLSELLTQERRFSQLARRDADRAAQLAELAQRDVDERWEAHERLAEESRRSPT